MNPVTLFASDGTNTVLIVDGQRLRRVDSFTIQGNTETGWNLSLSFDCLTGMTHPVERHVVEKIVESLGYKLSDE